MGRIIEHAGGKGFLQDIGAAYEELDDEREFVTAVAEQRGTRKWLSVPELIVIAERCEGDALRTAGKFGPAATTTAGIALKGMKDRVIGGYVFEKGGYKSRQWQLRRVREATWARQARPRSAVTVPCSSSSPGRNCG